MFKDIEAQGLVLLGCGKMGSALLQGWLVNGLPVRSVYIIDPNPSDWVKELMGQGLNVNLPLPAAPAIVLIAVKPQMMGAALPQLQALGNSKTIFLSIAAGIRMAQFADILGQKTPIIRAMPNTPASVARAITAIVGNDYIEAAEKALAQRLLAVVGEVVEVDTEDQIDIVTGVSGSGPAYVFHMIEALAAAARAQGLSEALAMRLARHTVTGAGELAHRSSETAQNLRVNVTSPGGTTAAALSVLMAEGLGLTELMTRTVDAAVNRGRELGK